MIDPQISSFSSNYISNRPLCLPQDPLSPTNSTNGHEGCSRLTLTLFLHVTWTLYLESGQSDSCTLSLSVSRLPISPPPNTSQVTRHLLGPTAPAAAAVELQATSADTSDPCRISSIVRSGHVSRIELSISGCVVAHWSQHYKHGEKELIKMGILSGKYFFAKDNS